MKKHSSSIQVTHLINATGTSMHYHPSSSPQVLVGLVDAGLIVPCRFGGFVCDDATLQCAPLHPTPAPAPTGVAAATAAATASSSAADVPAGANGNSSEVLNTMAVAKVSSESKSFASAAILSDATSASSSDGSGSGSGSASGSGGSRSEGRSGSGIYVAGHLARGSQLLTSGLSYCRDHGTRIATAITSPHSHQRAGE